MESPKRHPYQEPSPPLVNDSTPLEELKEIPQQSIQTADEQIERDQPIGAKERTVRQLLTHLDNIKAWAGLLNHEEVWRDEVARYETICLIQDAAARVMGELEATLASETQSEPEPDETQQRRAIELATQAVYVARTLGEPRVDPFANDPDNSHVNENSERLRFTQGDFEIYYSIVWTSTSQGEFKDLSVVVKSAGQTVLDARQKQMNNEVLSSDCSVYIAGNWEATLDGLASHGKIRSAR